MSDEGDYNQEAGDGGEGSDDDDDTKAIEDELNNIDLENANFGDFDDEGIAHDEEEEEESEEEDDDVDLLAKMFPDWDEDTLETVLSYCSGVQDAIDAIVLTGSPDTYKRQLKDERKAANTGDLVGKRVLIVQTGKDDVDGTYGKALKWDSEGMYYSVKLEKNKKTARVGPQCLKEVAKPVDEKTSTSAKKSFGKGISALKQGDVEGAIKILKGPSAPNMSWKHHGSGKVTWAAYQFTLGNCYMERQEGGRSTNLETAIYHLKGSLEVYTYHEYATQYAEAQNLLASAFHQLKHGSLADNLAHAIFHYKKSLRVYDRTCYPMEWAVVQANLATALRDRADVLRVGKPVKFNEHAAFNEIHSEADLAGTVWHGAEEEKAASLSIEEAIKHFYDALEVITKKKHPEQYKLVMENLALCYADRMEGDKDENMDRSHEYAAAASGGKPPSRCQRRVSGRRSSWRASGDSLERFSGDFALKASNNFAENLQKNPQKRDSKIGKFYQESILGQSIIPPEQRMSFNQGSYAQSLFNESEYDAGAYQQGSGAPVSSVTHEIRENLRMSKIIEVGEEEEKTRSSGNYEGGSFDDRTSTSSKAAQAHTAKSLWPTMTQSFGAPPSNEKRNSFSKEERGSTESAASPQGSHTAKSLWPSMSQSFSDPAPQPAPPSDRSNRSGGSGRGDRGSIGRRTSTGNYAGGGGGGGGYNNGAGAYNNNYGGGGVYGGGGGYGGGGQVDTNTSFDRSPSPHSQNTHTAKSLWPEMTQSFGNAPNNPQENGDARASGEGSTRSNKHANTISSVFPDAPPDANRHQSSAPFPTLTDM